MSCNDLEHFPSDYADSRARFLEKTARLAGDRASCPIPGTKDDDLAVDDVHLPATGRKERLIVILSGIHGLEAYAGSAIQSLFLETVLPKIDRRGTGVYLVHSMNPYGFKHHTRCTEGGVNLNRNCSADRSLYAIKNAESIALSERFIPKAPVASLKCALFDSIRFEDAKVFFGDVSLDRFIKGVGPGQFESARGLEFGGFGPEPQTEFLTERLKTIMPGYRDVIALDLHTGLGDRGRLHLLRGERADSLDRGLLSELLDPAADREVYDFTANEVEGFYKTQGATNDLFPQLAEPGQRIVALTMEFGTLGHDRDAMLESLNRWLLEHQGIHHGYASPDIEREVRARYLDKFFPREDDWRATIAATSRELFLRILKRAGALLQ